ncbi:translation initiation factor IF-1 [Haloferula sargassicola]|uniref:Translation initiation factor IF-1 n=1 Tax=Haloferula sargassicola TaxID=490096 RepID=A0ABP9UJS9_9BACT
MRELPVRAEAVVAVVLKPGLFELRLPNGKRSLGHLSKELSKATPAIEAGTRVTVELTPFDFDSARIAAVVA